MVMCNNPTRTRRAQCLVEDIRTLRGQVHHRKLDSKRHLKIASGRLFTTMMHFSNTVPSNYDHRYCAENSIPSFHMPRDQTHRDYHSLRDAHGSEPSSFSIATFGQ